jgi:hypothetical protein
MIAMIEWVDLLTHNNGRREEEKAMEATKGPSIM